MGAVSTLTVNQTLTQLPSGILSGSGTVVGNVISEGTVRPGTSPGTLSIVGDYTQNLPGTLFIELAGYDKGSEYDFLSITGKATLSGELDVDLLFGFDPATGKEFNILHAENGVIGTFSSYDLPNLPGRYWDVVYGPNDVTLGVQPVPLPSTLLLFGSGLVGSGLYSMRRRFKKIKG